jgi:hypothetical protein
MKEISIPLEYFNMDPFVDKTIDFIKSRIYPGTNPICEIVCVEQPGDVPISDLKTEWEVRASLNEGMRSFFFTFAYADEDGLLVCADGKSYRSGDDDEDSEDGILIGMEDSLGYLVKVENGLVIINTAIHAGGAFPGPLSSVELVKDCYVLEAPMAKFIGTFVTF